MAGAGAEVGTQCRSGIPEDRGQLYLEESARSVQRRGPLTWTLASGEQGELGRASICYEYTV